MTEYSHNGGPQIDVSKGYTIIHNDWANHPLVGVHSEYFRFWVDLLMGCAYGDGTIRTVNGHIYELRAGELVGAISYLANRWGVTPKRVRTFIDKAVQWRLVTVTKRGTQNGTQKGTLAQTIKISNYIDLYESLTNKGHAEGHEESQSRGTQGARKGHESNTTNYINTNNTNPPCPPVGGYDDFPTHVHQVTDWSQAFAHPDDGLEIAPSGSLRMVNGTRAYWLDLFDGDETSLDMAVIEAQAGIQPNSKQSKKLQIERKLAQIVRQRRDQDKRYAKAVAKPKPDKSAGRAEIMQQILADERSKLGSR